MSTTLNDAIDGMKSQMTSYLLYIMTLAGKLLKKSTEYLSSKYLGANFSNYFGVCQLILKPVPTYYVWTKQFHMQLCFDVAVHVKRDKNHFKLVMFWRHLDAICKKVTPSMNWTLDKDTQDMIDGIAGVMDINSSIVFCISESLWKLWRAHAR